MNFPLLFSEVLAFLKNARYFYKKTIFVLPEPPEKRKPVEYLLFSGGKEGGQWH